ncbi:hypothetical protein BASA61_008378 [Batrachochytrium salamandrivorans]|nr:hypothetical protein BASA61_008378 [Batrachochytrium salamandrivorans]
MQSKPSPYLIPEAHRLRIYEKIPHQRDSSRPSSSRSSISTTNTGGEARRNHSCTASAIQQSQSCSKNTYLTSKSALDSSSRFIANKDVSRGLVLVGHSNPSPSSSSAGQRPKTLASSAIVECLNGIPLNESPTVSTGTSQTNIPLSGSYTTKCLQSTPLQMRFGQKHSPHRPPESPRPSTEEISACRPVSAGKSYHRSSVLHLRQQLPTRANSREELFAATKAIYKGLNSSAARSTSLSSTNSCGASAQSILYDSSTEKPPTSTFSYGQYAGQQQSQCAPTITKSTFQSLGHQTKPSQDTYLEPNAHDIADMSTPKQPQEKHIQDAYKYVVIHVFDETRNVKRDFHCKKTLIIREMEYFKAYLSEDSPMANVVDIDVHCDLHIFERLIAFITKKHVDLDPKTVVSILISSNFLKMPTLEALCLDYIHTNINLIISAPFDTKCIGQALINRLAEKFHPEQIRDIKDPSDKIKSQLYLSKIEELIGSTSRAGIFLIKSCKACSKIYAADKDDLLHCEMAQADIDFRGDVVFLHISNNEFDLNKYIATLYLSVHSWEMVYWRIWGIIHHMNCSNCERLFSCIDFQTCPSHIIQTPPHLPQYSSPEHNSELHMCCGKQISKFTPLCLSEGCRLVSHLPKDAESMDVYKIFQRQSNLILWNQHIPDLSNDALGTTTSVSNTSHLTGMKNSGEVKDQSTAYCSSISELELDAHVEDVMAIQKSSKTQKESEMGITSYNPQSDPRTRIAKVEGLLSSQSDCGGLSANLEYIWRYASISRESITESDAQESPSSLNSSGYKRVYDLTPRSSTSRGGKSHSKPYYTQRSEDIDGMKSLVDRLKLLRSGL